MKNTILVIIISVFLQRASAQVTITPGAQFYLNGNVQLTLQNTDLVNNGNFSAGNGMVSFTGNTSSTIFGSQPVQFYQLEINKTNGFFLFLQRAIGVAQQVNFTSGLIDLNGNDLDLGTTGMLNGEQESSHITGADGGNVIFTTTLNAPSLANPGNLGMLITSSQNLGSTTIKRGHQSQVSNGGAGNSILRYYDIFPSVNTALNATLRFPYLDAELNGLDENTLVFWEKQVSADWFALGLDNRNTTANDIEKNAVQSFGRFTLSSVNNALPVHFILFNARCNGNAVVLSWKTAQEQNSHYYTVERSADAVRWTALGNVPAAGNAAFENDYSYVDNTAVANSYYRIAEYDMDGKSQLTKVLRAECSTRDMFSVWPNPVSDDELYISMSSAASSNAIIKIFDAKGALVRQKAEKLLPGNNLLSIDVRGIASGLYYTTVSYNNGQLRTQKIIKE